MRHQWVMACENLLWPLVAEYPTEEYEIMLFSCLWSYCIHFPKAWISDCWNSFPFLSYLCEWRKICSTFKMNIVYYSPNCSCYGCILVLQISKLGFLALGLQVQSSETYQYFSETHYSKVLTLHQYQPYYVTTCWETWIKIITLMHRQHRCAYLALTNLLKITASGLQ